MKERGKEGRRGGRRWEEGGRKMWYERAAEVCLDLTAETKRGSLGARGELETGLEPRNK